GNLEFEKLAISQDPLFFGQRFLKRALGRTDDLHALAREIFRETRQRESGAILRRLADEALQAVSASDQAQAQPAGLLRVESLNRYDVALHAASMGEELSLLPL